MAKIFHPKAKYIGSISDESDSEDSDESTDFILTLHPIEVIKGNAEAEILETGEPFDESIVLIWSELEKYDDFHNTKEISESSVIDDYEAFQNKKMEDLYNHECQEIINLKVVTAERI